MATDDLEMILAFMQGLDAPEAHAAVCPHCGQENEWASGFGKQSFAEVVQQGGEPVMVCARCLGVWIHRQGVDRPFTPEEWLDLEAEQRGSIQRAVAMLQGIRAGRKQGGS